VAARDVELAVDRAQVGVNRPAAQHQLGGDLRAIYRKLDVASRHAATRWALERGMV